MADLQIEIGIPSILVAKNKYCKECGRVHDLEKCPKCGASIEIGYGLMGGGIGVYKFCRNEKCNWFWKRLDQEE